MLRNERAHQLHGRRAIHLFAGAGGGILADRLLGIRTVCAVEIDPYCQRVLAARQADGTLEWFPVFGDVRSFDGRPWRGIADVVSGGWPCTDVSVAGRGAGIDGPQSGLWSEYARILGEVRPRFALMENSPALTSRGLGRVLGDLAALGFDAEWGVLGAGDVGANHRRDRIWIVAHAAGVLAGAERQPTGFDAARLGGPPRDGSTRGTGEGPAGGRTAHSDRDAVRIKPRRVEPRRTGTCEPRHDGAQRDIAPDPDCRRELQPKGRVGEVGGRAAHGVDARHADRSRLENREGEPGNDGPQLAPTFGADRRPAQSGVRRENDGLAAELDAHQWGDWREWGESATIGKLADRANRLKCLGNGQVPQCAAEAWRQLVARGGW